MDWEDEAAVYALKSGEAAGKTGKVPWAVQGDLHAESTVPGLDGGDGLLEHGEGSLKG
jgi:hypothetical protein